MVHPVGGSVELGWRESQRVLVEPCQMTGKNQWNRGREPKELRKERAVIGREAQEPAGKWDVASGCCWVGEGPSVTFLRVQSIVGVGAGSRLPHIRAKRLAGDQRVHWEFLVACPSMRPRGP